MTDKIMYTDEELSQSVYYPACGFDFRTIFAFSHISNFFIYADLDNCNLNQAQSNLIEYLRTVNQQLAPGSLSLVDAQPVALWPEQQHKLSTYEFTLKRVVGQHERQLKLVYICGEGLAVYSCLFKQREVAPRVLVTIQSGRGIDGGYAHFEEPNGIVTQFLESCARKPLLWVRGGIGIRQHKMSEDRLYNTSIQKYIGWSAEAFRQYNDELGLVDRRILHDQRTVVLRRGTLRPNDVNDNTVFLTQQVRNTVFGNGMTDQLIVYEKNHISLEQMFAYIEKICQENNYVNAITIPCGYEDEGLLIKDWVKKKGLPEHLEIWFDGEFDFADLRGFASVP